MVFLLIGIFQWFIFANVRVMISNFHSFARASLVLYLIEKNRINELMRKEKLLVRIIG